MSENLVTYYLSAPQLDVDRLVEQLHEHGISDVRAKSHHGINGISFSVANPTQEQREFIHRLMNKKQRKFLNEAEKFFRPTSSRYYSPKEGYEGLAESRPALPYTARSPTRRTLSRRISPVAEEEEAEMNPLAQTQRAIGYPTRRTLPSSVYEEEAPPLSQNTYIPESEYTQLNPTNPLSQAQRGSSRNPSSILPLSNAQFTLPQF